MIRRKSKRKQRQRTPRTQGQNLSEAVSKPKNRARSGIGQICTNEPAIPIPEEHVGIRLEDMIVITDTGYDDLSPFVPIEIDDIERTMRQPGAAEEVARSVA
jgi:Xaa-Pro aminopeptidase